MQILKTLERMKEYVDYVKVNEFKISSWGEGSVV